MKTLSGLAVLLGVGLACGAANADVQFQTGNIQYSNVNIAADIHAITVAGEVDHTGVNVYFEGFGTGPGFSPVELHGQHGVAFIEVMHPDVDQLFKLTVTAQAGWAFANMDWKLDAMPPNDGNLTFFALDAGGNVLALSSGTNSFAFDHNGQNPFHVHTSGGSTISTLEIYSTVAIADLKQISVDLVPIPTPGTPGLLAFGAFMASRRRR